MKLFLFSLLDNEDSFLHGDYNMDIQSPGEAHYQTDSDMYRNSPPYSVDNNSALPLDLQVMRTSSSHTSHPALQSSNIPSMNRISNHFDSALPNLPLANLPLSDKLMQFYAAKNFLKHSKLELNYSKDSVTESKTDETAPIINYSIKDGVKNESSPESIKSNSDAAYVSNNNVENSFSPTFAHKSISDSGHDSSAASLRESPLRAPSKVTSETKCSDDDFLMRNSEQNPNSSETDKLNHNSDQLKTRYDQDDSILESNPFYLNRTSVLPKSDNIHNNNSPLKILPDISLRAQVRPLDLREVNAPKLVNYSVHPQSV